MSQNDENAEKHLVVEWDRDAKEAVSSLQAISSAFSNYTVRALCVRHKDELVSLWVDYILSQGQDLTHEVAKYDQGIYEVIHANLKLKSIDDLITSIENGFSIGEPKKALLIHPNSDLDTSSNPIRWRRYNYQQHPHQNTLAEKYQGIHFYLPTEQIEVILTKSGVDRRTSTQTTQGQHFQSWSEFAYLTINRDDIDTGIKARVNIYAPFWTSIEQVRFRNNCLIVEWNCPEAIHECLDVVIRYHRSTPGPTEVKGTTHRSSASDEFRKTWETNVNIQEDVDISSLQISIRHRGLGFELARKDVKLVIIHFETAIGKGRIAFDPNEECLDLSSQDITMIDLSFVKHFPELKDLILTDNQIDSIDLTPLMECENLTYLDISENPLEDINLEPISSCHNLMLLYFRYCKLQTIILFPLENCSKLESIELVGNPLSVIDVSPLYSCHNLRFLTVSVRDVKLIAEEALIRDQDRYVPDGLVFYHEKYEIRPVKLKPTEQIISEDVKESFTKRYRNFILAFFFFFGSVSSNLLSDLISQAGSNALTIIFIMAGVLALCYGIKMESES